jgi:hypothetical protein
MLVQRGLKIDGWGWASIHLMDELLLDKLLYPVAEIIHLAHEGLLFFRVLRLSLPLATSYLPVRMERFATR